jgi:hypothetical protein
MKKNCETEVVSRFGLSKIAKVYDELRALYEGKTVTDLGMILSKVIRLSFDDRNLTIEQHILDSEKKWNLCVVHYQAVHSQTKTRNSEAT